MAKYSSAVENYFQNVIKKSWTWNRLTEEEQRRFIDMEFKSAIVDELGCVMYWCDELQDEDQIECILNSHPEWNRKCIEM